MGKQGKLAPGKGGKVAGKGTISSRMKLVKKEGQLVKKRDIT